MQKNNPDQDDNLFTNGFNRIASQNNEENDNIGVSNPDIKRNRSNREGSSIKHRIPPTIVEEYKDMNRVSSSRTGERYKINVAIGESKSSRDALIWALKHLLHDILPSSYSSTFIYLIHVYPEIIYIPTPLGGMCHKDSVNPLLFEDYKNEKIEKRKKFIDEFLRLCSGCKVKVDTLLIESNDVAKAVIDLIPILNIKKLVIGTSKSSYRKLKRPHGIADQILKADLPATCDIKIIGRGKELIDVEDPLDMFKDKSPSSSSRMGSTYSSSSGTIKDKAFSLFRIFSSRSSSSNDGSVGNLADFDP
ncbi:hypothetical protein MKW98_022182 [Papaver atlanticum]|uniref:Uncharacterized protein n=1 Tax=Papaver atlanticum TaxID=357466 RepID=A0AAD4XRZ5_9MAGN|nr:hypothetical protein MKW98_022182 [Papaver atlanticum]